MGENTTRTTIKMHAVGQVPTAVMHEVSELGTKGDLNS